ncbi:MAG: glycosyltransferase family 4 protein [bacterium]|nr:glycosyltransferase family 4 protein [bacterium]
MEVTPVIMSPLKMFEYLAMGRLLISSDLPVLREVLNEDVAMLCQPENLWQWQAAILKAAGDPM